MPTADDLRALARSSPWLWSTLHLRCRAPQVCEVSVAWVTRPDDLVVVTADGVRRRERRARSERRVRRPDQVEVGRRPDGLVLNRPDRRECVDMDLMWQTYLWVAMLDPVELSVGVELSDVRSEVRRGRETWWARARPVEGYEPRCACCPLLWSVISDELEHGADPARSAAAYPKAYEVGLDRQTGVVVSVEPVGLEVEMTRLDLTLVEVGLE